MISANCWAIIIQKLNFAGLMQYQEMVLSIGNDTNEHLLMFPAWNTLKDPNKIEQLNLEPDFGCILNGSNMSVLRFIS